MSRNLPLGGVAFRVEKVAWVWKLGSGAASPGLRDLVRGAAAAAFQVKKVVGVGKLGSGGCAPLVDKVGSGSHGLQV